MRQNERGKEVFGTSAGVSTWKSPLPKMLDKWNEHVLRSTTTSMQSSIIRPRSDVAIIAEYDTATNG